MTKKLLQKTQRYYMTFSIIALLIVAPLSYYISNVFYLEETDQGLELQKKEFVKYAIPKLNEENIKLWNEIDRNVKIDSFDPKIVQDKFNTESHFDELNKENQPYRILKTPIILKGKKYTLFIRRSLLESEDLIGSIVIVFVLLIILLLAGLYFITCRLSSTLWKPFYQSLREIEKFEVNSNSSPKLISSNIEEFNRLNLAIERLTEKNILIYKSQKEFLENAAHELQTPIAIFKGKIETLLQDPNLSKEQFEIVDKLNETVIKFNRLNKNLLLLSRIKTKHFSSFNSVSFKEIINSQLSFFEEQAQEKNLKIELHLDEDVIVSSNLFLCETLVSNLFSNAINHNVSNGKIKIYLNQNTLRFSNSGPSKSLQTEKLYERFSKANSSSKGNGLGLSIIKKIVDNNRWKINYQFTNSVHIFEIEF